MTKQRDTVPAAPDTTATPPATDTGAGTSEQLATEPQAAATQDAEPVAPAFQELEYEPEPRPEPGSLDFDADAPGVRSFELREHLEILKLRKELADLDKPADVAPVPVTVVAAPTATAPEQHDPTDIVAVHPDHADPRRFSALAWKTLETQGTHGGWEPQVSLPSPLPTHD